MARASGFPSSSAGHHPVAAFIRRDFAISRSYRFPFALDLVFGGLQLVVYFFISETFGDAAADELGGAPSYFAFAAVGVILATVIQAAIQGVSLRVREEQLCGSLEALMAQPLSALQLCAGLTAFPFAYALARAAAYLALAAPFMDLDAGRASWIGLVCVFVTTAAALACLGIVAAAAVLVFKQGDVLSRILLFGMTLASGAVFPVSALPGWLEALGSVLPFRFAFDGARNALFEGADWAADALALAAFAVVGLPLSIWLFQRALVAVRRAGTLGQY